MLTAVMPRMLLSLLDPKGPPARGPVRYLLIRHLASLITGQHHPNTSFGNGPNWVAPDGSKYSISTGTVALSRA